uniref:Protein BIG1 n=1 Tax=Candidozyma auris TaxID=498019 RepID=A0A0L0NUT1_CANAR
MRSLAVFGLYASTVLAFANTAPMYGINALLEGKYLNDIQEVSSRMESFTKKWCSNMEKDPLILYRVKNLAKKANDKAETSSNIRYDSPKQLDLAFDSLCQVHYSTSLPEHVKAGEVYVVDLDDEKEYSVNELFLTNAFVTVQGKPSGGKTRSLMSGIRGYVDGIQQGRTKRDSDESDLDAEAVAEEVESAFRAAESMIAHEEGDSYVTALGDDVDEPTGSKEQKTKADQKSNLFTNYQFFTPGIWLSLIISLFLIYVLYTAVNWITSIQVTYKSFEKQEDFQKKTE